MVEPVALCSVHIELVSPTMRYLGENGLLEVVSPRYWGWLECASEGSVPLEETVGNLLKRKSRLGQCGSIADSVLKSDCGGIRVNRCRCGNVLACKYCRETKRREILQKVVGWAGWAVRRGLYRVFLTLTVPEAAFVGLDRWSVVFGRLMDKRIPLSYEDVFRAEMKRYEENLTRACVRGELAASKKEKKIRRQWWCFDHFSRWMDKTGPYPKIGQLVAGGYRFLHAFPGESKDFHPHVHCPLALYSPIPQVLLSKWWEEVSGGPVVDIVPVYGNSKKIAWYVGEKACGKKARKGVRREGSVAQAGRLVVDAYLSGRHRRKSVGVERREMEKVIASVEVEDAAKRKCPHCNETGCSTEWYAKIEDGPIEIRDGKKFNIVLGTYKGRVIRYRFQIVDAFGRCVGEDGLGGCLLSYSERGPP